MKTKTILHLSVTVVLALQISNTVFAGSVKLGAVDADAPKSAVDADDDSKIRMTDLIVPPNTKLSDVASDISKETLRSMGESSITPTSNDSIPTCVGDKGDPQDPFHHSQTMPGGKYKGQCINSANYRSSRRLSDEEIVKFGLKPDPSTVVMANFHHADKFYVAIIPVDRIQDAVFQFLPLIGNMPFFHGNLRFRMAKGTPVKLVEQTMRPDRKTIELAQDDDIAFAEYGVRAVSFDGQHFSIPKGFTGAYGVSYQFESLTQGADYEHNPRQIRQYKLNLDRETVLKVFNTGLDLATERDISVVYNTLEQSCLNAIFDAIAKATNIDNHGWYTRARESAFPVQMLKHMKLIDKNSRIKDYKGLNSDT